jgi:hypothetical protein
LRPEDGIGIKGEDFTKIIQSCEFFGCDPWICFVTDRPEDESGGKIFLYLMSLDVLKEYHTNFFEKKDFSFSMTENRINRYDEDPRIMKIVFDYSSLNWFNK